MEKMIPSKKSRMKPNPNRFLDDHQNNGSDSDALPRLGYEEGSDHSSYDLETKFDGRSNAIDRLDHQISQRKASPLPSADPSHPSRRLQSYIIETAYDGEVGATGAMFDIRARTDQAVRILSFTLNVYNAVPQCRIRVHTKPGTHRGFESNRAAWTLVADTVTECMGLSKDTMITSSMFSEASNDELVIQGGSVRAIYIESEVAFRYSMTYSPYSVFVEDNYIQIMEGTGVTEFFKNIFTPRMWNGSLSYSVIKKKGELSTDHEIELDDPVSLKDVDRPKDDVDPNWCKHDLTTSSEDAKVKASYGHMFNIRSLSESGIIVYGLGFYIRPNSKVDYKICTLADSFTNFAEKTVVAEGSLRGSDPVSGKAPVVIEFTSAVKIEAGNSQGFEIKMRTDDVFSAQRQGIEVREIFKKNNHIAIESGVSRASPSGDEVYSPRQFYGSILYRTMTMCPENMNAPRDHYDEGPSTQEIKKMCTHETTMDECGSLCSPYLCCFSDEPKINSSYCHTNEICTKYSYCSNILREQKQRLNWICSIDNLATEIGIEQCNAMCKSHLCCFRADEPCDDFSDCFEYQICQNLFPETGGTSNGDLHISSLTQRNYEDDCKPWKTLTEEGKQQCKKACAPWSCCWSLDDTVRCHYTECVFVIKMCDLNMNSHYYYDDYYYDDDFDDSYYDDVYGYHNNDDFVNKYYLYDSFGDAYTIPPVVVETSGDGHDIPNPTKVTALADTTECKNVPEYRFRDEAVKSCIWIGATEFRRRDLCSSREVRENCPMVCGLCCADDPEFLGVQYPTGNKGCAFLNADVSLTLNYCFIDEIKTYCPVTCENCKRFIAPNTDGT